MSILRDDGAVVYLNGIEVYRTNMQSGSITYTTLASTAVAGADEPTYYVASFSKSSLVTGTNVPAVEIHQSNPSSSDFSFNLCVTGTTDGSAVNLIRGPYLQLKKTALIDNPFMHLIKDLHETGYLDRHW